MTPTIFNCLFSWRAPISSEEELSEADVILTHEFGDQQTVSKTTADMVDLAVALSKKYNKPLICQYPGNIRAESLRITPLLTIRENLLVPHGYLDTEEVNRQAALFCKEKGWKKVILVTHPHHIWRAGLNLAHNGLTPLYPDVRDISYDSSVKRWEITSPLFFVPREICARLIYLNKGYLRE